MRRLWSNPRKWSLLAAAVFGLFAAWLLAAGLAADLLVVERPLGQADAIAILSGAADYKQRAAGGAAAFLNGAAHRIIITNDDQRGGWDDTEKGNPYFVDRMRAELIRHGVPDYAIEVLPGAVGSTADEAERLVDAAADRKYKRLLLVTSDYHSRRALWIFERKAGSLYPNLKLGIVRAPSDDRYPGRHSWWLSPRGWRTVAAEYLKFAYYWLYY